MVHIERKCPLEAKNIAKTAKNGIKKGPATETLFDIAGPFSYITLSTRGSPKATHIAEISLSYIFITALKTIFFLSSSLGLAGQSLTSSLQHLLTLILSAALCL